MSITLEMKSHLYLLINRPMGKASCRRLAYFRKNNTLRFFIIKNLHIPSILDQTDSILFQSVSSLFKKFENYSFFSQCIFKQIYVLQKGNLITNANCVGQKRSCKQFQCSRIFMEKRLKHLLQWWLEGMYSTRDRHNQFSFGNQLVSQFLIGC